MKRNQSGSIALAFLIVLALSIAGNALLWHQVTKEHDARTAAETKFDTQVKETQACNDSVTRLEQEAKDRDAENTKLRQEAQNRRRAQEALAQQILSTPPAIPGDDCGSAKKRIADWLKGRKP
jgi:uncharacterized protein HemX